MRISMVKGIANVKNVNNGVRLAFYFRLFCRQKAKPTIRYRIGP